jgi:DNA-binding NarL/FixJ family response regulator
MRLRRSAPEVNNLLAEHREDPATEALRHLAWEELGQKLSDREKAVFGALAEGRGLRETGRELGLCASAMSATRNSLAGHITEE